jgi:hypothetical protein
MFKKWRIPNSERGREGPSGASNLSEKDISTEFFSLYLKKTQFKECSFRPMYLCGETPDFFLFSILGLLK